jgi:hypothetical protein
MSHLDGIHYGYDEVSGQDNIPLTYSMEEWDGEVILAARNEYPSKQVMMDSRPNPYLSENRLVRNPLPPPISGVSDDLANQPTETKERFCSLSGGSSAKNIALWLTDKDLRLLALMLMVFVIVMQIKMMIKMELLMATLQPNLATGRSSIVG